MRHRRYETLILLSPSLTPTDLEAFKAKIDGILEAGQGLTLRLEDWGRRRLAYPVRKEFFGFYVLYDYRGLPSLAAELERNLKIDEHVFKFLTLVLNNDFTLEAFEAEKERLAKEASRKEAARSDTASDNEAESQSEEGDQEADQEAGQGLEEGSEDGPEEEIRPDSQD
jgi:small subunit ribosomal protein S6